MTDREILEAALVHLRTAHDLLLSASTESDGGPAFEVSGGKVRSIIDSLEPGLDII